MKIYYIKSSSKNYFRNPIFQMDIDSWVKNYRLATGFLYKDEAILVRNFLEKIDFLYEILADEGKHSLKIVSRKK